jgi:membrane protease YdiL (CAAX protease family)
MREHHILPEKVTVISQGALAKRYRSLPALVRFTLFGGCAALAAVSGFGLAVIPVTLFLLVLEGRKPDSLGLSPSKRRLAQFSGGLVLGSAMVMAFCLLLGLFVQFGWQRNEQVTTTVWLAGICFYVQSSVVEEFMFRGYGFQRLQSVFGIGWAQGLTALLFAAYHMVNAGMPAAEALLFPGLGSLLFGYAFVRSGGVMLPIGIHAGWNFWQEQLAGSSGRAQAGIWKVVLDPKTSIPFSVVYILTLLVTMAATLILRWSTHGASRSHCGNAAEESSERESGDPDAPPTRYKLPLVV